MKSIFWTGYCKENRITAISKIEKIVSEWGYITNFKLYSDISLSLKIELDELNIDQLYSDLIGYMDLDEFEKMNSTSKKERSIFFNVTFTKSKGEIINDILSVPG